MTIPTTIINNEKKVLISLYSKSIWTN